MNRKKLLSIVLTAALVVGCAAALTGCQDVEPTDTSSNGSSSSVSSKTSETSKSESSKAESSQQSQSSEQSSQQSSEQSETSNIPTPTKVDYNLTSKISDGVMLHAWCWSFNTIKENMGDIAAAGYSTIQTSPANSCVAGGNGGMQLMGQGKWYYQYQPTDWTIGNYQLGTEEEFKAMCAEADKYGIKIIVDVVPNHTTSTASAVSQNLINAVGGIDNLYHQNGKKTITNYSDRLQCTTYSLSGLPDVNTENTDFQNYFIKYLDQCIADGADGFRYDTAKHIGLIDDPQENSSLQNTFWQNVTTKITNADSIFNYGEVLQGDNERIADYVKAIGHTTASAYGSMIQSDVTTGKYNAAKLSDLGIGGSTNGVTWVESHDNYTDGSTLKITDNEIIQGWAVIAASGNGTPLFYDRPFEADSNNQWGSMNRIGASGSILFKDPNVTAVNHFRNAMVGESTTFTNPYGSDTSVVMVSRGAKGVVLVNGSTADRSISTSTSLADGTYTNRTGGNQKFTVSGGKLVGTLPANSIAVLYNDGYVASVSMPSVSIETSSYTTNSDTVSVVLHAQNSAKNVYSVNGTEKNYSDGQSITFNVSSTTPLKVSATNSDGRTSTMTYYFTKTTTVAAGESVKFEKPASWSDSVNIYIYDETVKPVKTNAAWPGEKMTKNSDGTYSYALKQDWSSGLVIFSDGNGHQYPASMEPGAELVAGKTYKSNITETSTQESSSTSTTQAKITFKKPSNWGSSVNAYVYENGGGGKNAVWPGEKMTDNGDGTYSYLVPTTVKSPVVIFNDGSNQYPASGKSGLLVSDGKVFSAD